MKYYDNLIQSYYLNDVDISTLSYLKDTNKLKYDKHYNEKFWDFLKHDNCTKYIHLKDDASFEFIDYENLSLFDFVVTKIIKPVINNHLNVSDFMDTFYKFYVKDYIDKMANTVKNYTVESSSYESIIPPFETGWVKFHDTEYYTNTIDLLTSIVLHKFTKYKFKIVDSSKQRYLNCRLFDLLMNSDYIIKKLTNKSYSSCSESYINYKSVRMFYNYISNSKDFNQYISIHGKTAIEFVKKLVRYVFIEQFRQAIPHYLMKMRKYDEELNSIISDIELYYTKNLSILRKNNIYFNDIKQSCKNSIEGLSKIVPFDPYTYISDINSILMSIIKFVPVELGKDLKEIHTTINNTNISKEVLIDSYKSLENIISKLYVNSTEVLNNSYNFSFIKRWNELLKENTLWIPEDYICKDKKFLTD